MVKTYASSSSRDDEFRGKYVNCVMNYGIYRMDKGQPFAYT